jgi:hypothetical protein
MNRLFSPGDPSVGRIHDQLAHLAKILVTREQLSDLIETAFWASLQFNEGRTTRVCVSVVAPETSNDAVAFATPIAYNESQITKLSPAVPRGGCLLVSTSSNGLSIWGFGRSRPGAWCGTVTIEVSEPGTVRVDVGPFQPFAVLNGRSDPMIAGTKNTLAHFLQRVMQKALPVHDMLETQAVWRECLVLVILARMIVADGHGGIVLIVPTETGAWAESLSPFAYRFAAPDTAIRDAIRQELKIVHAQGEALQGLWQTDVPVDLKNLVTGAIGQRPWYNERDVRAVASLAGVDGAIVVMRDLSVLGFGAKIALGSRTPPGVCTFRPEPGSHETSPSSLEDLGGTRHQSAARFAGAHKDAVALVISQDRHMSVMYWDEPINCVAVVRNAEWL